MKWMHRALALLLCLVMAASGTLMAFAEGETGDEIVVVESTPCTECGVTDGHADTCSQYVAPGLADTELCADCGLAGGAHSETCSQYVAPADPEPADPTLCETLLAAESVEEMYLLVCEAAQNTPELLTALTSGEIDMLYARVNALDPEGDDPDTQDMLDMLSVLYGTYDDNDAVILGSGTITDDYKITGATDEVTTPITIKNVSGGEANWTFINGTLTINATVTIPSGEKLDILVGSDDSDHIGKIVAGSQLGDQPMFIVESGAMLKIAKTTNNDEQNYGSVEIAGGKIVVESGGTLYLEDIATVSGNAVWNIASGANFHVLGDIPVSGSLTVTGPTTIARTYTDGSVFYVKDGASLTLNNVTINGNNLVAKEALIQTEGVSTGRSTNLTKIELNNVTLKNARAVSLATSAGIKIASGTKIDLDLNNCVIDNCASGSGSAIYLMGYAYGEALIYCTRIENCVSGRNYTSVNDSQSFEYTGEGGTIRTNGNVGVKLTMQQCIMSGNVSGPEGTNRSDNHGGCVYWNACNLDANGDVARMTIIDCQFIGNTATSFGGAIFNEAFMEIGTNFDSNFTTDATTVGNIRGTLIMGNSAKYGGGIEVPTYGGGADEHDGIGAALTLRTGVFIIGNTASYGGGLAMRVGKGSVGDDASKIDDVDFKISCEGAIIQGNTATVMGGGIYLEREVDCDYYPSAVELKSGTITGNSAPIGGAICVYNANNAPSTKTNEVVIGSDTGELLIEENQTSGEAGLGGAVYISYGDVEMVNGTVRGNNAGYGGAICVENGEFVISGGVLQENTATGNGGAVYVTGGSFTMTNGTMSSNSANNGGAAYVTGGEFTMSGGTIDGGKDGTTKAVNAQNGGAVYVTKTDSASGSAKMSGGTIQNCAAVNGGAVYVSGGDFTMTSGTLTKNFAFEITSGNAEAGSEGYGGAVYAAEGNIYIGVEDCTAKKETHDVTDATLKELTHPVVNANTAVFGGALAVNGGKVYVYCGSMTDNASANEGTGQNVFMTGTNSEFHHYLESTTIGTQDSDGNINHGIVSVGGELTVHYFDENDGEDEEFIVIIEYNSNFMGGTTDVTWTGEVPKDYRLNLPYCDSGWKTIQGSEYSFVGWTENPKSTETDPMCVRKVSDYSPVGTPVTIVANTTIDDKPAMRFYAVWAPTTNTISYAYSLDNGTTITPGSDAFALANKPTSYTFAMVDEDGTTIGEPTVSGYAFVGWRLYASNQKISNWDMDATKYDPESISDLEPMPTGDAALITNNVLDTEQRFGDIVLVAIFEPMYANLTITHGLSNGNANDVFQYRITCDPYDQWHDNIDMIVTVHANDTDGTTIQHLPVGNYTVTQLSDWTWRYSKPAAINDIYLDVDGETETAAFSNSKTTTIWLSGDSFEKNFWGNN